MSLVLFGFDTGDYNLIFLAALLLYFNTYFCCIAIEDTRYMYMENGYTVPASNDYEKLLVL